MKSSTSGAEVAGIVIAALLLVPLLTLIPTLLWYCFDDALALLVGVPALGTIAWYHMWPFTMFVGMLVRVTDTNSNNS